MRLPWQAAAVLDALLEKYAESGIFNLESMDVLKVNPIRDFGSPVHIMKNIFQGKEKFESALWELTQLLYAA